MDEPARPGTGRRRPTVVLVTGAPGSGKTTLARLLSAELRLPFLGRDQVRGGLSFTAGAWSPAMDRVPPADEATETFLRLVEAAASHGVSCVAEYVVRSAPSGPLDRLRAVADCRVVLTVCDGAVDRFAARNRADRFLANRAVLTALGMADAEAHTAAAVPRMQAVEAALRTTFPVPTLRVETTDGYRPDLERIIEFATAAATDADHD